MELFRNAHSEIHYFPTVITPRTSYAIGHSFWIKNSFEYSIFKKLLYALEDFIAQTIWLRITSEQEESPVTKVRNCNSISIPAMKKQTLLFLAITPYLPNN